VKSTNDGGGTLQTINNVDYGTVVTAASAYTGTTPTTTQGDATNYPFEGWTPASAMVTGNTTFTAKFGSPVDVTEISDDWDTIIAAIDSGAYKTRYKIGQYKPLDLGTEGTINMQIVAMDADVDKNDDTIPLTFVAMELLNTDTDAFYSKKDWSNKGGAGTIKGKLRNLTIPSNVSSRIISAKKITNGYENGAFVKNGLTTYDSLWIPSIREIMPTYQYDPESFGADYSACFKNVSYKKKRINAPESEGAVAYWTRSISSISTSSIMYVIAVSDKGSPGDRINSYSAFVCLGFCLGLEQST
jgi:hypothetical protein